MRCCGERVSEKSQNETSWEGHCNMRHQESTHCRGRGSLKMRHHIMVIATGGVMNQELQGGYCYRKCQGDRGVREVSK